jgi:hypothetical protein
MKNPVTCGMAVRCDQQNALNLIASSGTAELTIAGKSLEVFRNRRFAELSWPVRCVRRAQQFIKSTHQTTSFFGVAGRGLVILLFLSIFLEDCGLHDKLLDYLGRFTPSTCHYIYLFTYLHHAAESFLRS